MSWDFDNILTFITANFFVIITTITGIIGAVLGIWIFIMRQKDREIKIHVEKIKEPDHRIRKIRVRYVNKIIEKCNISFNGILLIWDNTESQTNFTIFEGGQETLQFQMKFSLKILK